jgi:hypothetical protein
MAKVSPSVGSKVMVRLALMAGMPEEDPSDSDMEEMRKARTDPVAMKELVDKKRKELGKKDSPSPSQMTVRTLQDQFFLYPRRRPARVDYVDLTAAGPTAPRDAMEASDDLPGASGVNFINVMVFTLGSTVQQPAVGHYPKWAQERFRLEQVQWFDEEPEDNQDIHVAFPVPDEQ